MTQKPAGDGIDAVEGYIKCEKQHPSSEAEVAEHAEMQKKVLAEMGDKKITGSSVFHCMRKQIVAGCRTAFCRYASASVAL